jgi:hypothetical protein
LTADEVKILAEELALLIAALETELALLVNTEYEKLVENLFPSGRGVR